jgi:large subunit ribosomal protein L25
MELAAEKREKTRSTKEIIRNGYIPAVISGKGMESVSITVKNIDYKRVYQKAGETDLIDINVDKDTYKVLIRNTQLNPVSDGIIHAEFYKPNLKEKTEAEIPVEVLNAELNPLVKSGEGVVIQLINEIRVKSLPTDLPHSFVIDALKLTEIGSGVCIEDLDYDKEKVEVVDSELSEMVVKLDRFQAEEETPEVSEEDAIAAMEATKEKEDTEEESEEK